MERITYFTPGPVQMAEEICAIGGRQVPYFRNKEFSEVVLECERILLKLAKAPKDSKVLLLTASGTGGMEAAIANFASHDAPLLAINTQGFGQRIIDICQALGRPVESLDLTMGVSLKPDDIGEILPANYSSIMCNAHDTISGVWNHITSLGKSAQNHDKMFIVDAISSFLCDPIDMEEQGIDVLIAGSQKALALAPGLVVLILSPKAVKSVMEEAVKPESYYFDLKPYLENGIRGQQPFTPAVGIVYQLLQRLKGLEQEGVDAVVERTKSLAYHFREAIEQSDMPFRIYPDISSNAVTVIEITDPAINADLLVSDFVAQHGLFLTPNGGKLKDTIFRVSHMGEQTHEALTDLVDKLQEYIMFKRDN